METYQDRVEDTPLFRLYARGTGSLTDTENAIFALQQRISKTNYARVWIAQ